MHLIMGDTAHFGRLIIKPAVTLGVVMIPA